MLPLMSKLEIGTPHFASLVCALGLTLTACSGSEPEVRSPQPALGGGGYDDAPPDRAVPYDFDSPPAASLSNASQETKWWEGEAPCPEGSALYGGLPPEHDRVGCKTDKGKNVGSLTKFHPNGMKKEEGTFEDNFAEGVWVTWDPEGNLESETPHARGKKHGIETLYFPGGEVKSQRTYREGKRHGTTTIWDDRERKRTILTYVDGKKDGPEARYDIEGRLARIIDWQDDERVGER